MWAFPWGVPGTPLADEDGPDEWQREQLRSISAALWKAVQTGDFQPVREATSSGHGIGKSALVCWIVMACIMTYTDARAVITANTDTQLRTKTWAEMAKWYNLLNPILRDMFELTATALHSKQPGHERTWRADAIPWSKSNPAAYAGQHNAGKRLLMVMDEASEIVDEIYDTAEGALTDADTEIVMAIYGNPTQATGRFKEIVAGRFRAGWRTRMIDSRKVKRTNKAVIAGWIAAFGEDSDFVRVRVRGVFPRVGMTQFISTEFVEKARARPAFYIPSDPLVLGVDVAWYGNDRSVLCPRRGNDARTIPWQQYRGDDPMFIAQQVALFHQRYTTDAIFVDVGGMGAGVYARLLQLRIPNVYPIDFGSTGGMVEYNGVAVRTQNKRSAMWAMLREALRIGLAIPNEGEISPELELDLTVPQYGFAHESEIQLEKKEHMRERGYASPDLGDALALTFAFPIPPRMIRMAKPDAFDPYAPGNQGRSDVGNTEVDQLYRGI